MSKMKNTILLCIYLTISPVNMALSANQTVVIPLLGSCSGTAQPEDVVSGKTFSNSTSSNLTGVRPLTPLGLTGGSGCWDAAGSARACLDTGEDAEYRLGEVYPGDRFIEANGGYQDQETGLVWGVQRLEDESWQEALNTCNNATVIDNGTYSDWRLPNIKELLSVIFYGHDSPALRVPPGHAFSSSGFFWSSTSSSSSLNSAWIISLGSGATQTSGKINTYKTWCVRGNTTGFQ